MAWFWLTHKGNIREFFIFFTPTSPFLFEKFTTFFRCFYPKIVFPLRPRGVVDGRSYYVCATGLRGAEVRRALGSCGHQSALPLPREHGDFAQGQALLRFRSFITKCCFLRVSTHGPAVLWPVQGFPRHRLANFFWHVEGFEKVAVL